MQVIVDNQVTIRNYDKEILSWCWGNLVMKNPEYYKKERMRKWIGNTPREIVLFEKNGDDLILPFGCLNHIWSTYKNRCRFERKIAEIRAFSYNSSIGLYDYQEKAVNKALEAKNGVIVMPCGAGKTQTALEIIARIGGKALWLTHTQDLLNQSLLRAKSVFDADASAFGTITGGKVNIGNGITFATIQTMVKLDLPKLKNYWDIIIVDECHKAIGSPTKVMQFYKVLSNLSCRYKFGITATPKRADGLEKSMFALLGGIIHEVSREDVKDTTCPVQVITCETGYIPDYDAVLMGDGTINYAKLVDDLIHDEERFKTVLETIEKLPANSPVLVLANRIEYLQKLNRHYFGRSNFLSANGNSKSAKEERKRALQALNDGDIDCLFASYQLAAEGLDCPNLKYVVFATPEKDPTRIQQASGRVGRKAPNKDCGIVIDFVDSFGMYQSWKKKRETVYKKLGYDII